MPPKPRKITVNGETLTAPEWAEKIGVTLKGIQARVYRLGWTWEKAVSTSNQVHKYKKDQKFKNWTLVEETGKRTRTGYCVWLCVCDCGYSTEISTQRFSPSKNLPLLKCPKCQNKNILEACGKTQTLEEWSRETGLITSTIRSRLYAGKSPEEAVSIPLNPRHRPLTHNGETLLMSQWAKKIGITKEGLRQRLEKMPIEEALSETNTRFSRKGRPIKITINVNGESKSINEWSEISGRSYQAIYRGLRGGCSPEEAVFGKNPT